MQLIGIQGKCTNMCHTVQLQFASGCSSDLIVLITLIKHAEQGMRNSLQPKLLGKSGEANAM